MRKKVLLLILFAVLLSPGQIHSGATEEKHMEASHSVDANFGVEASSYVLVDYAYDSYIRRLYSSLSFMRRSAEDAEKETEYFVWLMNVQLKMSEEETMEMLANPDDYSHVELNVRVKKPKGKSAEDFSCALIAPNGRAWAKIGFDLNEHRMSKQDETMYMFIDIVFRRDAGMTAECIKRFLQTVEIELYYVMDGMKHKSVIQIEDIAERFYPGHPKYNSTVEIFRPFNPLLFSPKDE